MQCPHYDANRCRSCTELPVAYADQLAAKQQACAALLAGHAGVEWLAPVASAERHFRNKAKMVVSGSVAQPILGIRDASGQGVDLSDCALYPPSMQACFAAIAQFITCAALVPYDVATRTGELKFVLLTEATDSGALLLRLVTRSQEPLARIRKHLPSLHAALPQLAVVSLNLQPQHMAVLEGEREIVLSEQSRLGMQVNGLTLQLHPQSFFQTNSEVAGALYRQARAWVEELAPATVWDLYCGVGGFALHCAGGGRRVTGVEASAEAIASAQASCAALALAGVEFVAQDATAFALASDAPPQLVVVNPPRRGIGEPLARWLDASAVRWLIYSSCNAESLARDLQWMPRFRLLRARVLDMFAHTRHYEVITLLERRADA